MLLVDVRPVLGPGDEKFTNSSGAGTGRRRSNAWLKIEKIAALAPLPRVEREDRHGGEAGIPNERPNRVPPVVP